MKISLSPEALADLRRLTAFVSERDARAGDDALALINASIASLARFPGRGARIRGSQYRRLSVRFGRSGYLIDYAVNDDAEAVLVLRVRHSPERR